MLTERACHCGTSDTQGGSGKAIGRSENAAGKAESCRGLSKEARRQNSSPCPSDCGVGPPAPRKRQSTGITVPRTELRAEYAESRQGGSPSSEGGREESEEGNPGTSIFSAG